MVIGRVICDTVTDFSDGQSRVDFVDMRADENFGCKVQRRGPTAEIHKLYKPGHWYRVELVKCDAPAPVTEPHPTQQ